MVILHGGGADPEVPVEIGGGLGDGFKAEGVSAAREEEVALVDVADDAGVEEFDSFAEGSPPAALGSAGGDAVVFAGGFDELGAFEDVVGDGLFDVNVFAGLHGPDGGEGVPVVGGGDGDGVDGFVIEGAAHVGVEEGALAGFGKDFLGGGFGAGTIDFDEGCDFDVGDGEEFRDVSGAAATDADDGDAEAVIGLGPGLGGGGGGDEERTTVRKHLIDVT